MVFFFRHSRYPREHSRLPGAASRRFFVKPHPEVRRINFHPVSPTVYYPFPNRGTRRVSNFVPIIISVVSAPRVTTLTFPSSRLPQGIVLLKNLSVLGLNDMSLTDLPADFGWWVSLFFFPPTFVHRSRSSWISLKAKVFSIPRSLSIALPRKQNFVENPMANFNLATRNPLFGRKPIPISISAFSSSQPWQSHIAGASREPDPRSPRHTAQPHQVGAPRPRRQRDRRAALLHRKSSITLRAMARPQPASTSPAGEYY